MINQYLVQSCKRGAEISHSRNRSIPLRQTFFVSIYLGEELIHLNLYSRTQELCTYITLHRITGITASLSFSIQNYEQSRTILLIHIHK